MINLDKTRLNWVLPFFQGEVPIGGGVGSRIAGNKINHICLLMAVIFLVACNSESAPDCFQNTGDIVRDEVVLVDFTKITVFENVGLVLKEGPEIKVEVETGEFLRDEVEVTVTDGRLLLRNTNDCNYVREYGLTKVYVTAPNITEIRSSTGLKIESDGVLAYKRLTLISESFNNSESETTDGEFDLQLDTDNVTIVVNGITYFKLRGKTEFLVMTVAAGDSRIEAEELQTQFVDFDHRGSNDLIVNPQQLIKGEIRGTGDVISLNQPPLIQVEELYKGRLIFKD